MLSRSQRKVHQFLKAIETQKVTAILQLANSRCLRTEVVRCSSDEEYQCKLHCIRMAFQWLLQTPPNQKWLVDTGRQVLADLMIFADKDPRDFLIAYEDLMQYLAEPANWIELEQEMNERDVKALTFFDIALDLILMDAFDDLDSPPSCVSSVVGNRWLSNGFKEAVRPVSAPSKPLLFFICLYFGPNQKN